MVAVGQTRYKLQPRLYGEAHARTLQKEQTSEGFPYQAIALMCCERVAVRQMIMGLNKHCPAGAIKHVQKSPVHLQFVQGITYGILQIYIYN